MVSSIFRSLPPFKGKQRLARFFLKSGISAHSDIVVRGRHDCIYTLPNVRESVGFEIFINGEYESDTIDFIVKRIPTDSVFLDIGANIGAISIPVCKQRPDLSAICVEASPWVFSYLEKNIHDNALSGLTLLNKAITESGQGQVTFYSPKEKYGKGSLSAVFTTDGVNVDSRSLGNIIESTGDKKVGLIKIDIEGYEYYAFKGAKQHLTKVDAPDILFEFVDWAENQAEGCTAGMAQQLLLDYGYKLYFFEDGNFRKMDSGVVHTGSFMFLASKSQG